MSSVDDYFSQVGEGVEKLRDRNSATIREIGKAAAAAMLGGGRLLLHDTGHMVSHELVFRTGGVPAFAKFDAKAGSTERDLLFVVSVSGVSQAVVDTAMDARRRGTTVVALTSVEFSASLAARHSAGVRLKDEADFVLDNVAPPGDAFLEVPGVSHPVCPFSGVANAMLMWAVVAATTSSLAEVGVDPSVYPSINLPDGPELVRAVDARYAQMGF